MKLPKELTTVTPLSKILAAVFFITFPFISFFLGMQYQYMTDLYNQQLTKESISNPPRKLTDQNSAINTNNLTKICNDILQSPINPEAGIEFERAYCSGELCVDKSKEACEAKDIIKAENNKIVSGTDGKTDCYWEINIPAKPFCRPNFQYSP